MEQRQAMNEQGAKKLLGTSLGVFANEAHSVGTPGFGLETPSFLGVESTKRSAEASVVSSGVASPVRGGQLSPWILEAEALVNEGDSDTECPDSARSKVAAAAWAASPTALLQDLMLPDEADHQDSAESRIEDEDELDKVAFFLNTGASPVVDAATRRQRVEAPLLKAPATSGQACPVPRKFLPTPSVDGACAMTIAAPQVEGWSPQISPAMQGSPPDSKQNIDEKHVYAVGESVSYWSKSHRAWMSGQIVERKSRSVYIVDKQSSGCLSKMRASELISEAEVQQDPLLRALGALGETPRQGKASGSKGSKSSSRGKSGGRSARAAKLSPAVTPRRRGCVVRDDFSDDSDDDGAQPATPLRTPAPPNRVRSPMPCTPSPPVQAPRLGRIVRDDFSDDSD